MTHCNVATARHLSAGCAVLLWNLLTSWPWDDPTTTNKMTTQKTSVLAQNSPTLLQGLNTLDAVLLLVGGVIGSGIFLTAGEVAKSLRRPDMFLLVWVAGGVVSLLACFAVAELAGMFPKAGGQYVFLREAYGELPAFLYGWMIFAVVQTGTIAALSVGFSLYFGAVFPALGSTAPLLSVPVGKWIWTLTIPKLVSIAAIAFLTWANVIGLRRGAALVNVATWLKFGAMGSLVFFGLLFGKGDWHHFAQPATNPITDPAKLLSGLGVALISVLFAFDGWIYITWVAGEIKDAARALPRALIIGTLCVVVIYVAMNVVYIYALPLDDIINSTAVVQSAAKVMFTSNIARWLALMVSVSCFGAMSSAILCTARIFYAMAQDGVFFSRMAEVHPKFRTPAFSLIAQGVWGGILALIGLYDQLLTYSIFMMIVGYGVTVGALFVLRKKQPDTPRPYHCTGYPVVPALYIVFALAWTLNTVVSRPLESLGGLGIVALGIPGYVYWKRQKRQRSIE